MTESLIAVVEWSPGKVRAYNPATRQSATDETVDGALRKVGAPSKVGLCLSRRISFVREARLPDVEKHQARMVLDLRLDDIFPAMGSSLSFDFVMGAHRYDDGVQTTVTAVPSETLRQAKAEVKAAGAEVAWTAPVALGSIAVGGAYAPQAYAVAESDGEFLNIDVVRHGSLVFARSILDPVDSAARSAELARTVAASGVSDVVPVSVNGMELIGGRPGGGHGPLEAMAEHDGAVLDVVTPEEAQKTIKAASSAKNRLALLLWLGVVCVGGLVWNDRMDAADAVSAISSKDASQKQKARDVINVVNGALNTESTKRERVMLGFAPAQQPSDVLSVVANAVPNGAWLTGATFERGKMLQVRGVALRSDAVGDFTTALALDDRFRDVKLVFSNNAEIESTPVVQFAITMHVVGNLPLDDKDVRRKPE